MRRLVLLILAIHLLAACSGQQTVTPDVQVTHIASTCDASVGLLVSGVPVAVTVEEAECSDAGCTVTACVDISGLRACHDTPVPVPVPTLDAGEADAEVVEPIVIDGSADPKVITPDGSAMATEPSAP